jgi:hypothetical protein
VSTIAKTKRRKGSGLKKLGNMPARTATQRRDEAIGRAYGRGVRIAPPPRDEDPPAPHHGGDPRFSSSVMSATPDFGIGAVSVSHLTPPLICRSTLMASGGGTSGARDRFAPRRSNFFPETPSGLLVYFFMAPD